MAALLTVVCVQQALPFHIRIPAETYVGIVTTHILYGQKLFFVGNLFWQIGGFKSHLPIFPTAKLFTAWCHHYYVISKALGVV